MLNNSSNGDIIVIGYGNDLRGDDAAGLRVAALVEERHLAGVVSITRHQLTPELAELISNARAVIFVDASLETSGEISQIHSVEPAPSVNLVAHVGEPGVLLALAETIYGRRPHGWCIHVPARNFELGTPLSALTEHALPSAVEHIQHICGDLNSNTRRVTY